jgi:glyceraldehyde 3-phosphate dehydrogenase
MPKTTSCVKASSKVLSFLSDCFQAISYRVPTSVVSSADISVKLNEKVKKEQIIEVFKKRARNQKFKIFYNNFEPLVSTDFIGSEYSCIIDHRWTEVNKHNYLKLVLWYDNEWGYSCRTVDLARYISDRI